MAKKKTAWDIKKDEVVPRKREDAQKPGPKPGVEMKWEKRITAASREPRSGTSIQHPDDMVDARNRLVSRICNSDDLKAKVGRQSMAEIDIALWRALLAQDVNTTIPLFFRRAGTWRDTYPRIQTAMEIGSKAMQMGRDLDITDDQTLQIVERFFEFLALKKGGIRHQGDFDRLIKALVSSGERQRPAVADAPAEQPPATVPTVDLVAEPKRRTKPQVSSRKPDDLLGIADAATELGTTSDDIRKQHKEGRLGMAPVRTQGAGMWFAWKDVEAAVKKKRGLDEKPAVPKAEPITLAEAAKRLGIRPQWFLKLIRQERIALDMPTTTPPMFDPDDIEVVREMMPSPDMSMEEAAEATHIPPAFFKGMVQRKQIALHPKDEHAAEWRFWREDVEDFVEAATGGAEEPAPAPAPAPVAVVERQQVIEPEMTEPSPGPTMSASDVARLYGMSSQNVRKAVQSGMLVALSGGDRQPYRFTKAEVERWRRAVKGEAEEDT